MKTLNVREKVEKKVANVARKITATEVNSACPLIAYQPKLPVEVNKLRKF